MYPGLSVNFAIYVENDLKIFPPYDVKVIKNKNNSILYCILFIVVFRKEISNINSQVKQKKNKNNNS